MPDLYSIIADTPRETQEMLANALTIRAGEDQMVEMRRRYFGWLDIAEGGRGLEIGSGTGHVTADLLACTGLASAVGLDPSPVLVEQARANFGDTPSLSFVEGDARETGLEAESFDLVVFHTSLCHIPGPEKALSEAFRVVRPGGVVAVFDGDYATNTAALAENDPLQLCVEHVATNLIHDIWLCRRLPRLLTESGFGILRHDAHPYLARGDAPYFMTLIDRGADFMARDGLVSADAAAALKEEARARLAAGRFFGFISFNSVIARKPG